MLQEKLGYMGAVILVIGVAVLVVAPELYHGGLSQSATAATAVVEVVETAQASD